jgi:hypothetical protein
MQNLTLTEPTSQKNTIELRIASINKTHHQQETPERHFTKLVIGDPGVNAPVRTHYPRSYNPDGPGGNYQGL